MQMLHAVMGNMQKPVYQEINTLCKSIGRVSFSWSFDQEKSSLHRCIILSQTKNIEKVLFKFLSEEFVHLLYLFKFSIAQQLI